MVVVVYGLGNNEYKYFKTKHNLGRIMLEEVASLLNIQFEKPSKADLPFIAKTKFGDISFYFLYSNGYMNNSGVILQSFYSYFKILPSNSISFVFQDDSDQLSLKHKLVQGGGTAGHNGIESIYKQIPTLKNIIWRLKIGIRPFENKSKSETFVLKNAPNDEIIYAKKLAKLFVQNIDMITINTTKFQAIINSPQ
jgi:peptidyl-tRNA hydrolase, PTH1 family